MMTTDATREERALATIETAERLARRASEAIADGHHGLAYEILAQIADTTTATTCTLVKDQVLSDRISAAARVQTMAALARAGVQ